MHVVKAVKSGQMNTINISLPKTKKLDFRMATKGFLNLCTCACLNEELVHVCNLVVKYAWGCKVRMLYLRNIKHFPC